MKIEIEITYNERNLKVYADFIEAEKAIDFIQNRTEASIQITKVTTMQGKEVDAPELTEELLLDSYQEELNEAIELVTAKTK